MKPSNTKLICTAVGLALYGGSAAMAEVKISSDDGKFETTLGGRLQVDAAWYSQDNVTLDGQNGTEFTLFMLGDQGVRHGQHTHLL